MKIRATFVYEWEVKVSDFGNNATPDYVVERIQEWVDECSSAPEELVDVVVSTKVDEVK